MRGVDVLPFRLELRENLALGVISDVADFGEAPYVEFLCPELRHNAVCLW